VDANFQVGSWLVKPGLNTVSQNGTTVHLEPKVMAVLVCLADHAGEPVAKEKLLQTIWPDTFVTDGVLIRSISELRRVFEDEAKDSRFIQTIPKRGYRLVAPFAPVSGADAGPISTATVAGSGSATHMPRWIRIAAVAAGTALLIGGFVAWMRTGASGWLSSTNGQAVIHSLAVLPLQNLSGDPSQEYFADAMTEELITELSRISALDVISRTSVMQYKESKKSLPEIARELHADAVVEGSIVRSGNRVRITAQLIHAAKDTNVWAQTYDRDLRDVLTLQSAVANAIASEIQVKVTPEEQAKLKSIRPVNPKALDAYVEARFHLDKAIRMDYYYGKQQALEVELDKAASYLDKAIHEDPNYIPAYVAYFETVDGSNNAHLDRLPKANDALMKALQMDETNVEVHLAMAGLLMQYEYNWPGAEKEYRRALELGPKAAEAHAQYANYLDDIGRTTEAAKERNLAQALDPSHDYFADAGVHRMGNTVDEDRKALDEKAPDDPYALAVMGKEYAIAGRFRESVEIWERSLALYGWKDFVNVLRRTDQKRDAKLALAAWMRAAEEYDKRHGNMPVVAMAFTYSSLGNKDRAFAWLDKAVEQRSWMIIYLKVDPVWDPLRSDPRFGALLRRVGLPL